MLLTMQHIRAAQCCRQDLRAAEQAAPIRIG